MSEQRIKVLSTYLVLLLLLASTIAVVKFAWISADAPYYISVARDLSESKVVYKDFTSIYTPLVMYLNSILFVLFSGPSYLYFLIFQLLIIFTGGALFYFIISRIIKLDYHYSLFLVAAFVLAILSSDGNYINLEVYSIVFVLFGFFLILQDKYYFVSGLLLGFAFMCKQYGVLNFIPFGILILIGTNTKRIKFWKLFYLSLGGIVALSLFLGVFVVVNGVSLESLIDQLSGSGYAAMATSKSRSIISLLIGAKVFLIFLTIVVVYVIRSQKRSNILLFCLAGIVVNLIPVLIQNFQHYYINTFPYLFLAIGFSLRESPKKIYFPAILCATLICSFFLVARLIRYRSNGATQHQVAKVIREYLPAGSTVYIDGNLRYLYFLNNYHNPFMKAIGYDYSFVAIDTLDKRSVILSGRQLELEGRVTRTIKVKDGEAYIYSPISIY